MNDSQRPIRVDAGLSADFFLTLPEHYSDIVTSWENLVRKGYARRILKTKDNYNLDEKLRLFARTFDGKLIEVKVGKSPHVLIMFNQIRRSLRDQVSKMNGS